VTGPARDKTHDPFADVVTGVEAAARLLALVDRWVSHGVSGAQSRTGLVGTYLHLLVRAMLVMHAVKEPNVLRLTD
jgi:hypothetical protein